VPSFFLSCLRAIRSAVPPLFSLLPFFIFPFPLVLFWRWLVNEVVVFQPRWAPVLWALELPLDSFGLENRRYCRGKLCSIYMYSGCMVIQVIYIYIFIFLSCNFWFCNYYILICPPCLPHFSIHRASSFYLFHLPSLVPVAQWEGDQKTSS
jgi:hypothetical protein